MKSVLVSHPQAKPDAQGVAAALEAAGLLGAFFTGVAIRRGALAAGPVAALGRWLPRMQNRLISGVEGSRLHAMPAVELMARLGAKASQWLSPSALSQGYHVSVVHDAVVASAAWPRGIDGVYAYEDIASRTFRRAAERGLARVYDLPTPHYAWVERVWRAEAARWPEALQGSAPVEPECKKGRKSEELALATHVSVASRLTASSLEAIGCRLPIHVTPYGFPVDRFPCKERMADGPFTVLAVGHHSLRKGIPYLLEAWRLAGIRGGRLRLVGPMGLPGRFLRRYEGCFEHVAHVPRVKMAAEYQAADVLVFPTLCDGFGLVIQESMCCGTPVITTPCGGGPECITPGQEGWLIPAGCLDALVEQLRQVACNRDAAFRIGQAARRRAEDYPWSKAGASLVEFIRALR